MSDRQRGLFARLFGGGRPHAARYHEPARARSVTKHHQPPAYEEEEVAHEDAAIADTPRPAPTAPPATPIYQSEVPAPIDVCNTIASLCAFSLPHPPASEQDTILQLALQQLCHYFLGAPPPSFPQAPTKSKPPYDYITAAYAGLPPKRNLAQTLQRIVDPAVSDTDAFVASVPAADRALLSGLFPRLMLLFQGIMKHLYSFDLEPTPEHHELHHVWDLILGSLDQLRIVLLHAETLGLVSYEGMPRLWGEIVSENVQNIQRCLRNLQLTELELSSNTQHLTACNEKILNLRRDYDAPRMNIQLLKGRRALEMAALHASTSVDTLFKNALLTLPKPPPATSTTATIQ